jgi:NADH-quinone oxidoreductase subunit G
MRITVDDREIEVREGRMLLQALDDAGLLAKGVDIPHFCWHPKLEIDGSCRLCQVEVVGEAKLQIACNTPVVAGMVVRTDSERVRNARAGVMELLLVNHPLDCPICDQAGECRLQDFAFDHGVPESRSREPRRTLAKNVAIGPEVVFDQERCILCRRCVRFCDEVTGTGELGIFGRGDASVVDTFPGLPLDNAYSMNVTDLCPVGALTTRDFRFKMRVWDLEEVDGVCVGCSRGCNIHLGVAKGAVQRTTPRRNDAVNDTWICDQGRLSYRAIGAPDRLKEPLLRAEDGRLMPTDFMTAIETAAARIRGLVEAKGAGVIAGIASPHATNEDLFMFWKFLDALGADTRGAPLIRGAADEILIEAEKAANARGAREIGFDVTGAVAERTRSGGVDAAIVFGHDILDAQFLGGADALATLDTLVVLDTHQSDLRHVADILIPTRHAAEKDGTLTNSAGRVQRVRPAHEPSWPAWSEGRVISLLAAALGLDGFDGSWDVAAVSAELAEWHPHFAGIDLVSVGRGGRDLGKVEDAAAPRAEASR